MDHASHATINTHDLGHILRSVEPAAVLAPAHIIRRVIRMHRSGGGLFQKTPHRKSLVIARDSLLSFVDTEELDLPSDHAFASRVLLIQRPRQDKITTLSRSQMLLEYWRLLFHSKVDAHMRSLREEGKLLPADAVSRIHAIGQGPFDEIRAVLTKERYLLPPTDHVAVYSEFVAVYLELRFFLPHALEVYFPAIDSFERVDAIIAKDIDGAAIFEACRLPGAAAPGPVMAETTAANVLPESPKVRSAEEQREATANYERMIRRADKAAALGNHARAAMTRNRAVFLYIPDDPRRARNVIRPDIEKLAHRICKVLEIDDGDTLVQAMTGLLDPSAQGWNTPGTRLLYDLQAVCIDHEKDLFKLDLVAWVLSRGEVPIKRKLPAAKEVRLHQHLSKAVHRLQTAAFPELARKALLELLEPKLHEVEHRVRETLRPKIEQAVNESGLAPANPPEKVAKKALIEELLDRIIERGFITMGDLRDAISRNQLKLPDLTGEAFIKGDELLKIDKQLSKLLDGVYRRGELYRRWPQRMSSLAFGTPWGRLVTQYVAIPYLGAFLLLEMAQHIVHMFVPAPKAVAEAGAVEAAVPTVAAAASSLLEGADATTQAVEHVAHGIHFTTPLSIFITGTILLWLFHADRIRAVLFNGLKWCFNRFYGIVIELPSEIFRLPWVKRIANNRAARTTYRYLLKPAFFGGLVWLVCHTWGLDWGFSLSYALLFFILMNLLFNTRFGRGIEESAGELVVRTWRRFGWRVIVATVLWIVDVFKWLLDAFEELRYNVDEWLRFRTGENRFAFVSKLIFGTIWFFVSYFIVFCVTLLIEPQVNPIKHFPVVTVSHKVMIGLIPMLAEWVAPLFDNDMKEATIFVGSVVWLVPGIFGYLAWELKENWRLYAANRPVKLKPTVIGHHGETMLGLLRPGFHSGTVPKLYGKLRKLERRRNWNPPGKAERKHRVALHHVQEAVKRFVERDLIATLEQSKSWGGTELRVAHVHLGGNSVRVEIGSGADDSHDSHDSHDTQPTVLTFEEQSGWLAASISPGDWITRLDQVQRDTLSAAMSGFYKHAAVDLVREQIEAVIDVKAKPYDIDERGIVVWPASAMERPDVYPLERDAMSNGQAMRASEASSATDVIKPGDVPILFRHHPIAWTDWIQMWQADQQAQTPVQLAAGPAVVPVTTATDPSREA